MGCLRLLVASVALVAGISCTDDQEEALRSVTVAQATLGDAWPFVVESGSLGCQDGAVTFKVRGMIYGLNPAAREAGAPAPFPIWVWAGGPATDTKVSLAPLIERGLELCE